MTLTQTTSTNLTRDTLAAMDANDPLANFRDKFYVPEGVLYFDGNSLGAVPKTVEGRLHTAITREWGDGLVRSWNTAGWYEMPRRVLDAVFTIRDSAAGCGGGDRGEGEGLTLFGSRRFFPWPSRSSSVRSRT